MADQSILDLISIERQGNRLVVDFANESDAIWLERFYRAARPAEPFDFRLTTVDVDEGRPGAGVADVKVEGANIDNMQFEVSDDRFVVRDAGDEYDLMLRDDVALSHAETPTVPLTITATAKDGRTVSKAFVIEVLASETEDEPVEVPAEVPDDDWQSEDITGKETSTPMPEPVAFDAPMPTDYTLAYAPRIDLTEDTKHNLIYGEFGAVWEGGWDYKEAIELCAGNPPFLRTHMAKGSHAGTKSIMRGAGFDTRTLQAERALLTYKVRFKEGFEFVKGGKLPGLMGGDSPSGGSDARKGFSARMMWREEGKGELYLYCPNKQISHGKSIGRGWFYFEPGADHEIGQEVILNTVGRNDGWIRIWFDGQPILEQRGIIFRDDPAVLIEGLMHTIFFGGSDDSWGAKRDECVDTSDFRIYTP